MNFIANESAQKLRGGYYTPQVLAEYICKWAVRKDRPCRVLEPSCGDGVFIDALKGQENSDVDFVGIEIDGAEATKAKQALIQSTIKGKIEVSDFLIWFLNNRMGENFDAVVGNPPFIRYQYMPTSMQNLAEEIFTDTGLRFTKHANAWVPFVIASIELLVPGGRLGMIIPSEIFNVIYAQGLRTYLGKTCSEITIIDPEDLWFDNLLQGVVILFAEKKTDQMEVTKGLGVVRTKGFDFCKKDPSSIMNHVQRINGYTIKGKWTKAFLSEEELTVLKHASELENVKQFGEIASADVGIVTGANSFFLVDEKTVQEYDLMKYAFPMFGRSSQCPGVMFTKSVHKENAENGLPCYFIWITDPLDCLNEKQKAYIALGKQQKLDKRYKCRIREPWYTVPSVYATEIGMLKRSNDLPRLIYNSAKAFTTDTAYRIRTSVRNPKEFVFSFVNSLTALSAELEGRSYGGGVLELVPSEIEHLLVPLTNITGFDLDKLDSQIRSKHPEIYLPEQDRIVLGNIGLSEKEQDILRGAWLKLRNRRQRKSKV